MVGGKSNGKKGGFKGLRGVKLVHHRRSTDTGSQDLEGLDNAAETRDVGMKWENMNLRSMWEQRPGWLRGYSFLNTGDRSMLETLVNVVTSLPFIVVGLQVPRKKLITRLYADSVIGVGLVSSAYHSSRGEARKLFRWGDYAMIATASLCLSRALHAKTSNTVFMASAMLIPFHPLIVTAIHTGLMEATFAQRAFLEPQLRNTYALHTISSMAGGALFLADDLYPNIPYIHAAWHLVSALGVSTYGSLLH
ncbi:hypothetical protein O6H91_Y191800 [Diphasiastrum complanatum]|nr:hypothetical protein O6H91_Y191800 [Diphasiastrum complanatum]